MTLTAQAKNRKEVYVLLFLWKYSIIWVNTKTTILLQGQCLALDIYIDSSRLGIYPPPFISPLDDSDNTKSGSADNVDDGLGGDDK